MRPSAPGKRETPSRSIAFQTSLRTSSLERTRERYPPRHVIRVQRNDIRPNDRDSSVPIGTLQECWVARRKIAIVATWLPAPARRRSAPTPTTAPQKDKIADGVTIGGVDVGGMDAEEAEARRARASCWRRCATRSGSATTARAGRSPARSSKVHADIDARGRRGARRKPASGGLPGRLVRYVTGGERRRADRRRRHLLPARDQPLRAPGRRRRRPRSRRTPRSNRAPNSLEVVAGRERAQAARQPAHRPAQARPCSTPTPTTRSPPAPTTTKPEVTARRSPPSTRPT